MAEKSTVATPSDAVTEMSQPWEMIEALMEGTAAMREAGTALLPKWPGEEDAAYRARLGTAVLFPAYRRTVETLTGKPFSKPITLSEDMPPQIVEYLKDIDQEGRDINAFAGDVMSNDLAYGICGILVDFPPMLPGVKTLADERRAGLRPYWVLIEPEQILGWRAARVGGDWKLQQLRLMECVEVPDGEFGTEEIEQVRVLEPGKWSIYRKQKVDGQAEDWLLFDEGATTLDFIPYVPTYGKRDGFMVGCPPLQDLAYLNVAHWQSASDQQTILHVARVPILTLIGVDEDTSIKVGSGSAVRIANPQGDLKYVEHTGAAIEAGAKDMDALEERMRQAGAELLVLTPRTQAATATQVATENAIGMCALNRITLMLQDALNLALDYTAKWVGLPTGGTVKIYNDFGAATLQEASAQLLLQANQAGKLSDETLHAEMQRRGILSADTDWQTEKDRIDSQGPALGAMPMIPDMPVTANANSQPAAA